MQPLKVHALDELQSCLVLPHWFLTHFSSLEPSVLSLGGCVHWLIHLKGPGFPVCVWSVSPSFPPFLHPSLSPPPYKVSLCSPGDFLGILGQAGLELSKISLPMPPSCWGQRCVQPCLA